MLNTKIIPNLIVATSLAMASHAATAETKYYVGGNLAFADYSEDTTFEEESIDGDLDLTVLYARAGIQFHENFSSEVRLGFGIDGDTDDVAVADIEIEVEGEVNYFYGVYFRGGMQAGSLFYPYLIAGYTRGELDAEGRTEEISVSADSSESDLSYGAGIDIRISETINGNIEYMNYIDKGDVEVDGIAVGVMWSF